MNSKVENYLTSKKDSTNAELAKKFGELEDFYSKKLWHQLTVALQKLVKESALQTGTELLDLYNNVVSELENKINPLSLMEIVAEVSTQYKDPNEALTFVEKTAPKVKDHKEAKVLCNVVNAGILLHRIKDQQKTKKMLEETEKMLDEIDGVASVHGKFYLLASDLYCQSGAHADFYRASLRYLGCIDLNTLDGPTQQKHAFYLGLAALLGEGVYNFGELLAHPILESLKGTSQEWLIELLYVYNGGNIQKFESMKPQWSTQPDLLARENKMREKIRLLCLMEMTFKRNARDRQLTFAEIAEETGLPEGQVEVMVMKALSLGLVKGTIDQVDQKVNITWVQPRVLDKKQIASMMNRLGDWCKDVNEMQKMLEDKATSILTL
ncbi:regulatory particle non-ATPase 9 [Oratosquilla oratoria]|uniref:regulatory particle non-ATPase 9 n=1 Tax=Oratosquilla oratoria TaxID=337810 RepID=UPI003F758B96